MKKLTNMQKETIRVYIRLFEKLAVTALGILPFVWSWYNVFNPMLYPDLMEDNGFVVGLFSVRIKTSDGEIESSYYDYLTKYHQAPWWSKPIQWIKNLVTTKHEGIKGNTGNNPYVLSKRQHDIANMIRDDI